MSVTRAAGGMTRLPRDDSILRKKTSRSTIASRRLTSRAEAYRRACRGQSRRRAPGTGEKSVSPVGRCGRRGQLDGAGDALGLRVGLGGTSGKPAGMSPSPVGATAWARCRRALRIPPPWRLLRRGTEFFLGAAQRVAAVNAATLGREVVAARLLDAEAAPPDRLALGIAWPGNGWRRQSSWAIRASRNSSGVCSSRSRAATPRRAGPVPGPHAPSGP